MPDTTSNAAFEDLRHPDWQPRVFAAGDPFAMRELQSLRARHPSASIHDTLRAQLWELFETRHPTVTMDDATFDRLVGESLGTDALPQYGNWVWYPWSHRLVRVLPATEFTEVRLSRNRNKITAGEQAHLQALRIGIVGLSVGQATALVLAMEGIGGEFVLADFDTLSLSNLNRLRAGVHDLGLNKAVLTARQLYELNPYLRIRLYADGVQESNLDAFMTDGGVLDMVIEECDDMFMKWRIRDAARGHRIPVLMETSDRGTLDVERFDREPDRPVFHGRVAGIDADRVRDLSPEGRIAVGMAILGAENLSARLSASAVEIGASLRSWPQLASAVSLGAAANTDAVRRIALGEFNTSGRFYIDLESIVCDEVGPNTLPVGSPVPTPMPQPEEHGLSADTDHVRQIVAAAAAAPSGGNAQPWRFEWDIDRLRCHVDEQRAGKLLDFEWRATWLAIGAAAENAVMAAASLGYRAALSVFPDPQSPLLAFDLHLEADASVAIDPLQGEIFRRCTNRRLGPGSPLPIGCDPQLRTAAASRGAALTLLETPEQRAALGEILGRGDRIRFLSRALHAELMGEIRWSVDEATRTGDGIDLRTLELSAMDLAALKLTSSWRAMELVGRVGGGRNLEKFGQRLAAGSSAIGMLTIDGATPAAFFEGGRAVQRVWLTASALSLGFQPLAALPYLFMRADEGGAGLDPGEVAELQALRARTRALVPLRGGHSDVLWFRLARVEPPSVRALRRPVHELLIQHFTEGEHS